MSAAPRGRALVALGVGVLGIATAPMWTREVQEHGGIGPTVAAFWRVALAAPLMLVLMRLVPGQSAAAGAAGAGHRDWLRLALPGVFFAGDLIVWHWSFEFTSQANATLLANVSMILVTIAGWLWLKEPITRLFAFGGAVAFTGLVVLLGVDFELGGGRPFGDALGLVTAVFYACYLLNVKLLRGRYTTLQVMAGSSTACALVALPFALFSGEQFVPAPGGWGAALGLAWGAHCAGQGCIAYALARLPASFAVVAMLAQPVLVAVIERVRYDAHFSAVQVAGGALVLCGIGLARAGQRPAPSLSDRR